MDSLVDYKKLYALQDKVLKAGFSNEELIIRLKSFPKNLLNEINIIDKHFLNNFEDEFKDVIKNIENVSDR